MFNSDWYNTESTTFLNQGELIKNCPKLTLPPKIRNREELEQSKITIEYFDSIIISQSCDLAQNKIKSVLVCPYYTLDVLEKSNSFFKNSEIKEGIKRGYLPAYHLLNKIELDADDGSYIVVSLKEAYSVPRSYLHTIAIKSGDSRIYLKSPYKEHLSQAVARFFMRVGLPVDIPPFVSQPLNASDIPSDIS